MSTSEKYMNPDQFFATVLLPLPSTLLLLLCENMHASPKLFNTQYTFMRNNVSKLIMYHVIHVQCAHSICLPCSTATHGVSGGSFIRWECHTGSTGSIVEYTLPCNNDTAGIIFMNEVVHLQIMYPAIFDIAIASSHSFPRLKRTRIKHHLGYY